MDQKASPAIYVSIYVSMYLCTVLCSSVWTKHFSRGIFRNDIHCLISRVLSKYRAFQARDRAFVRTILVLVHLYMATSAEPGRKAPYAIDLRWRIVWQRIGMDLTFRDIASNLNISHGTAHGIYKRFEETGDIAATKMPSRPDVRKLDKNAEILLIGIILSNPRLQLSELCASINHIMGIVVSPSTVCRLLAKYGFTRKKIQRIAKQRCSDMRGQFMARILQFPPHMLVFLDETGCDRRDMLRKYGYSFRGVPAICHQMFARGQRVSAIVAIAADGLVTYEIRTGTVNSDVFIDFVRGTLIPELNTFDGESSHSIVIMDNLSVHHVESIQNLFHQVGILVFFLAPYSPDLNPIEEAFSFVKHYLKQNEEVLEALQGDPFPIIEGALNSISPEMCFNWVSHAGYQ